MVSILAAHIHEVYAHLDIPSNNEDSDDDSGEEHVPRGSDEPSIHRAFLDDTASTCLRPVQFLPGFYDPTPPILGSMNYLNGDATIRPSHDCANMNPQVEATGTIHMTRSQPPITVRTQGDSGANRSITNDLRILFHYQPLTDYTVSGIDARTTTLCEGQGIMKLRSCHGGILEIPTLFCSQSSGTFFLSRSFCGHQQTRFLFMDTNWRYPDKLWTTVIPFP